MRAAALLLHIGGLSLSWGEQGQLAIHNVQLEGGFKPMSSLPGSPMVPGSVVEVALQDDVILGQDREDAPQPKEQTREGPSLSREQTREAADLASTVEGVSLQDQIVWGMVPREMVEEKMEKMDTATEDRDKTPTYAESSKPLYKPSYKPSLKPSYKPSYKPSHKPSYKPHLKKHGTTFSLNFPKFKINFNNPFHKRKTQKPKPTYKSPAVKQTYQEPNNSYKPVNKSPAKHYKEKPTYKLPTITPSYEPTTYTPVYQQTTTKPSYIPSTTKPSYKPKSYIPVYQQTTTKTSYIPSKTKPAPEVKPLYKPGRKAILSYLPKPLFMIEKPFYSQTKEKLPYKPPPVLESYNSGFMVNSGHPLGPSGGPLVHSQVQPISAIWQEDFGDSLEEALDLEERVNRANFPSVSSFSDNFRTTIHWGGPGT